jgi:hypothetical protein
MKGHLILSYLSPITNLSTQTASVPHQVPSQVRAELAASLQEAAGAQVINTVREHPSEAVCLCQPCAKDDRTFCDVCL